jgi:hypothetical protein
MIEIANELAIVGTELVRASAPPTPATLPRLAYHKAMATRRHAATASRSTVRRLPRRRRAAPKLAVTARQP